MATTFRPRAAQFALTLAILLGSRTAAADDKDLLKNQGAAPNLLIVFGNSQTTEQPIQGSTSAWDGDGDSPASKMGAAKRIIRQFVGEKHQGLNIGLTTFAHDPNAGSIKIFGKHWLYSPLEVDFPNESWAEPAGTIERWGVNGEGPCTSVTVPACADRSPSFVTLSQNASVAGPFFGTRGAGTAYIYLDGNANSATKRIAVTLVAGKYGDAFSDGNLSAYSISGTHSMEVRKEYQEFSKTGKTGIWITQNQTPNRSLGTATISYVPSASLTSDLFYTAGEDAGKAIGFLNDPRTDFDVNASCSGWEFQVNSAPLPLIKVPRDYRWGTACNPAQDSYPCVSRLLRPQAILTRYDRNTGTFTTTDPDNPGYTGAGSRYADGCDSTLLGAVDAGLDIVENQAILLTRNGSQAPIKNLLEDIYSYFTDPKIDDFKNGKRLDDPDAACRKSAVILVYDNFNGCQNDNCTILTNQVLAPLKKIGVPVFVIGFGASAAATSSTGMCIAQNTGAVLQDGTTVGYFPVTTPDGLYQALVDISNLITEATKVFAAAGVAPAQVMGDQMVYFANFNAASNRSIWNGRINSYKLDAAGNIKIGELTITDKNDPHVGVTLPAPSNDPSSLMWNAGMNLAQTPGTGATNPAGILTPGAGISSGTYVDNSNDGAATTIGTFFYPGRKIVFSLPQGYAGPVTTLPIPASNSVPESRYDMTYTTTASWWPALKALLGPQTLPPAVLSPALSDTDAGNSLRFIWGDRDAVMTTTENDQKYLGLKLGDIFHSAPVLVGRPNDYPYYAANLHGYQAFFEAYRQRRRVLFAGANDGLLHAFDAGGYDRTPSACQTEPNGTPGHCYDVGTGAELFAYAPRAVMPIYKPLKDAVGAQTKRDEWTVDGSPTVADVFLDGAHSGTPNASRRAWHTVLVGSTREGSPFEGTSGASPFSTRGSYFALDITQPDELTVDGAGKVGPPGPASFAAPRCLNASAEASCGKDAPDASVRGSQPARDWPTVLWEITDTGDQDSGSSPGAGFPDMGEMWSKPAMGRVKVCTANCGNTTAPLPVTEDRYVAIFGGGFDRERLNRRGNWLYMIDVETGRALYRANSSCGVNSGGGACTPKFFGSIASEPAALDFNGDGYLDVLYVGDLKGQLWRVDLTDLRALASPPGGRFNNQLDLTSGSGRPFLLFQAPQPTAPATTPFHPIYYRPVAVSLGFDVGGKAALGLGFGTGDRDDILATLDGSSLDSKQRYYYVVDQANSNTLTESDLADIASPTAPSLSSAPANGWFLELAKGERIISNSLDVAGIVFFSTFTPDRRGAAGNNCTTSSRCSTQGGVPRLYSVLYATGNPYLGADRGETQQNALFLSDPVVFLSADQRARKLYTTENYVSDTPAPTGKAVTIKSWKESTRNP